MSHLPNPAFLSAGLMVGSGLRVMETVRLRVSDIDTERLSVRVREVLGNQQARNLSLAKTEFRHTPVGKRRRYQNRTGANGAQ